jgi:S-formylglutathione hydrolase FrmB
LFIGGGVLALGVVGAGVGEVTGVLPGHSTVQRLLGLDGPAGTVPDVPVVWTKPSGTPQPSVPAGVTEVTVHRMHSAARNTDVDVVTMIPAGTPLADLPVCVALHGRGGTGQSMATMGLPQFLTASIRSGGRPFAFVAVDGGDTYWVAREPSDDPQAMLLHELPGWLNGFGLTHAGGVPTAALGVSMGCFGSLVYARNRAATPLTSVATLSPALFVSWPDAKSRNVFANEQAWETNEPLRHVDAWANTTALGVWCGKQDPFYPAATQLAALAHPKIASFADGAHNGDYWTRVLPAAVPFVAG